MFLYALKFVDAIFTFFLKHFAFNRELPEVGEVIKDVSYDRDFRRQKLDVIKPKGKGPFPILLYVHGGGFYAGDKSHYLRVAQQFAAEGWLVVNMNYRLAPGHTFPSQLEDIFFVLQWLKDNAEEQGGDLSQMVWAGDSAGAYLVSVMAATLHSPKLRMENGIASPLRKGTLKGLLLFYGIYDLETARHLDFPWIKTMIKGFLNSHEPAEFMRSSALRNVTSDFPPCYFCVGREDPVVSESIVFKEKLESLGVHCEAQFLETRRYPRARHGFLPYYRRPSAELGMREAIAFARKCIVQDEWGIPL